jgi:hypothetical protein
MGKVFENILYDLGFENYDDPTWSEGSYIKEFDVGHAVFKTDKFGNIVDKFSEFTQSIHSKKQIAEAKRMLSFYEEALRKLKEGT